MDLPENGPLEVEVTSGKVTELDGRKIEFSDWWFNVHSSNTELLAFIRA